MRRLRPRDRRLVAERAKFLCEYCKLQEALCPESFEVDHIRPRKARGSSNLANLCLACPVCNDAKRAKTHGKDPLTGRLMPLFNPRTQEWRDHFS